MYKMNVTDSRHINWLSLFLGGFLAGIFLINIGRNSFFAELELFNVSSLTRLRYLEIDKNAFLQYVLRERMENVLVMCLLATTYIGGAAVPVYAFYMGTMAGIFLSAASMRYGLRGIVLVMVGILPQYFLLVPACIMLMNWCYRLNMALYHTERVKEGIYGTRKQYLLRKIPQLFVIVGVVIIGSVLESYVNPVLLSNFLKIF